VIALTATATPIVQNDIAAQLGLDQYGRFIQGFRRDNLGVEVVEVAPSRRADLVGELLQEDGRRPAIVYAPSRAQTETLANLLKQHFPAGAYHAGLDAVHRKRVQEEFVDGAIEVMVATIAFGMGIDKPDVRTVIHTALPGSLEAYYQEIGRAGRDGAPSRTLLMHSYADRRTHDFFFERDYPDPAVLDRIYGRLGAEPLEKEALRKHLRMAEDEFDKALEKLWIHGGAVVDYAENVSRGREAWRESYVAQSGQKQQQLDLMLRYAEGSECRMAAMVRHFGDLADSRKACGVCDFCNPEGCIGQRFREATAQDRRMAMDVIEALRGSGRSTGKLHTEICPHGEVTRDDFEELLGAMARSGLVRIVESTFEKDGRTIPFRKAMLTSAGEEVEQPEEIELQMKFALPLVESRKKGKGKAKAKKTAKKAPAITGAVTAAAKEDRRLEDALRAWRLAEAKKRGVPAFRILGDRPLRAVAEQRPATAAELLAIPGIGISTVEKFGAQIFRLVETAVPSG
jgi:superfamily II DNA helicase RecQ